MVVLRARMRGSAGWSDVTICNVSSRGLMARCAAPPPKGDFIEIRHRSVCIIGQVRWSQNSRFGIRTQDRVEISALLAQASVPVTANERRTAPRKAEPAARRPDSTEAAEASRRFARMFDWSAMGAILVAGGIVLADMAGTALREPLADARHALAGGR